MNMDQDRYPIPDSAATELEKMKNAARMIEEMTGCRFKHDHPGLSFIYPDTNRYLSIDMAWDWSDAGGVFAYRFAVGLIPHREPLTTVDMVTLRQEVEQIHTLLTALGQESFCLTPEDRESFEDFIRELEQQREEQEQTNAPVMG